jgi:hypothetical protein
MTDVYLVVVEGRHADVDVTVFAAEQDAADFAQACLAGTSRSEENLEDSALSPSMIADGWLAHLPYGAEGDCVRVMKRELRKELR